MHADFLDLLHALSAVDARFLVIGAYAVAVHGRPRATGDLDVWVEPTAENAERVWRALREFGAPLHDLTRADLAAPGIVFQIGVVPRRIDILTEISGVEFAAAWPRRYPAPFDGLVCPVIGLEDLLVNKRATGRTKDLADAELLELLARRP